MKVVHHRQTKYARDCSCSAVARWSRSGGPLQPKANPWFSDLPKEIAGTSGLGTKENA